MIEMQKISEEWVSISDAAKRAAPFDNTACFADGTRFLTDPLAPDYIVCPPDGRAMPIGMLPPEELEVRAHLTQAALSFKAMANMSWVKRTFAKGAVQEVEAHFQSNLRGLAACILSSSLHRVAATRISKNYPGVPRGLLNAAERIRP